MQEIVLDLVGDSSLGIKPDWTFSATRSIMERNAMGRAGYSGYPSRQDIAVYAGRDANNAHPSVNARGTIEREILVSDSGVRIFYPDQAGGWGHYQKMLDFQTSNVPLSTFEARFSNLAERAGVQTRFYGTNEVYVSPESYVERVRNTPAEIAAITPDWMGRIFRDQTYREILGDPNLEFSVERGGMRNTPAGNAPAPLVGGSLLTSGSNLGRNRNTATPRYSEPGISASRSENAQQTSASRQVSARSSPQLSPQQQAVRPEQKATAQDVVRAYSFANEQTKVGAIATSSVPMTMVRPYQTAVTQPISTPASSFQTQMPSYDVVKAFSFNQQVVPTRDTAVIQDTVRIFTPVQQQTPNRPIAQQQKPQQYTILPQVLQETVPIPPPYKPVTPVTPIVPIVPIVPPLWGGSGGGSMGGAKPQGRARVTDIFRYGQGIGSFGSVTPINFGAPRGRKK